MRVFRSLMALFWIHLLVANRLLRVVDNAVKYNNEIWVDLNELTAGVSVYLDNEGLDKIIQKKDNSYQVKINNYNIKFDICEPNTKTVKAEKMFSRTVDINYYTKYSQTIMVNAEEYIKILKNKHYIAELIKNDGSIIYF